MPDSVNSPKHYNSGKFEAIDVIEDWNLGFNLGNTVKYISRAGKKDKDKHIEDLEKAQWYLDREINRLKSSMIETITLSAADAKIFVDNCFPKPNTHYDPLDFTDESINDLKRKYPHSGAI